MTTKLLYLFEMDKLLVRPTPEQAVFERNYAALKDYATCVLKGHDMTLKEAKPKEPLSMNFSWFAQTMNGNVLAEFAKLHPETITPTGRKNYSVMLNGYECYIKKLRKGTLQPGYNHSNASEAICEQLALPDQDPLPVIFIGYTLSDSNEDVTNVYAVCFKGKERIWVSDLNRLQPPASGEKDIAGPKPITVLPVGPKERKIAK